jgi:hypothetical protein
VALCLHWIRSFRILVFENGDKISFTYSYKWCLCVATQPFKENDGLCSHSWRLYSKYSQFPHFCSDIVFLYWIKKDVEWNRQCQAWVSVAVFAGKLSKIMTNISQNSFSRVRDAEIHIDDAQSKMTHTVTALNLRILSSDVFLDSDTDYHRWSSSSFSSLSPESCQVSTSIRSRKFLSTSFRIY